MSMTRNATHASATLRAATVSASPVGLASDSTMTPVTRAITIANTLGLHARPAMQFVDLANQFKASVTVHKDGEEAVTVDGKSVMQMITLEATQGTPLRIEASGEDAEQAVEQLAKLVEDKFGEED